MNFVKLLMAVFVAVLLPACSGSAGSGGDSPDGAAKALVVAMYKGDADAAARQMHFAEVVKAAEKEVALGAIRARAVEAGELAQSKGGVERIEVAGYKISEADSNQAQASVRVHFKDGSSKNEEVANLRRVAGKWTPAVDTAGSAAPQQGGAQTAEAAAGSAAPKQGAAPAAAGTTAPTAPPAPAPAGSNTPEGVAVKAFQAIADGDMGAFVLLVGNLEEEISQEPGMKEMVTGKLNVLFNAPDSPLHEIKEKGGARNIEVLSSTGDENRADVSLRIHYGDGTSDEADIKLVRLKGKWKIDPAQFK